MEFIKLKINNTDYILKFTFNSVKLLDNFEANTDLEKYPMRLFTMLSELFYAGMNWANDVKYTHDETDKILEMYLEENEPVKLLTDLMELMNNSNFFKKLLKTEEKPKAKKSTK